MKNNNIYIQLVNYIYNIKKCSDILADTYASFVENNLFIFIKENFEEYKNINSIYEIDDVNALENLRYAIFVDKNLKQLNSVNGNINYTSALKVYASFIESLKVDSPIVKKYKEGEVKQVVLNIHERNPKLRRACIEHYGYKCQCCGFDFEKAYGKLGENYIEVHHLHPISQSDELHDVSPIDDMIPLCSNCHSMIHRNGEDNIMSLEELKAQYVGIKYK